MRCEADGGRWPSYRNQGNAHRIVHQALQASQVPSGQFGTAQTPPAVVDGVRTAPALLFYLGAGALAVAGVVEWPVDVQKDQPSANEFGNLAHVCRPKTLRRAQPLLHTGGCKCHYLFMAAPPTSPCPASLVTHLDVSVHSKRRWMHQPVPICM